MKLLKIDLEDAKPEDYTSTSQFFTQTLEAQKIEHHNASRKQNYHNYRLTSYRLKKCAFTLAEVLITLGIIGVVAAMTIPSITANYRKQSIEKKLAKYYSAMNQAILQSEEENGAYVTWDFSLDSQTFYDTYLAKYLKTLKVEKDSDKRFLKIFFADGTMAAMGFTSCINFFTKVPKNKSFQPVCSNTPLENEVTGRYGKDLFEFRLCGSSWWMHSDGKKFEPWGAKGCATNQYIDEQTLYDGCKNPESGRYCTELIRRNGWKIPDNYPVRI